jgi:Leucine Rich repeat
MRRMLFVVELALALTVLPVFGAAVTEGDVAGWVAAQGGSVTRDAAGRITGVNLRASWITDGDLEMLGQVPGLQTLDLSLTRITDLGLEHLKSLAEVRDLNLYYCEFLTDVGIARLKGWKKLERLNLRGTKITDTSLEHLASLPALASLDVGFTQITSNGGAAAFAGAGDWREQDQRRGAERAESAAGSGAAGSERAAAHRLGAVVGGADGF